MARLMVQAIETWVYLTIQELFKIIEMRMIHGKFAGLFEF
jgi:hypothetical protein